MKLTVSGMSRKTTVSKGVDCASGNAMTRRVLLRGVNNQCQQHATPYDYLIR